MNHLCTYTFKLANTISIGDLSIPVEAIQWPGLHTNLAALSMPYLYRLELEITKLQQDVAISTYNKLSIIFGGKRKTHRDDGSIEFEPSSSLFIIIVQPESVADNRGL